MIDAALVYRGTVRRRCLIGFGMPFSSGDLLPVASIYSGHGIALDLCIGKKQIRHRNMLYFSPVYSAIYL